jgi:hypothetical protein
VATASASDGDTFSLAAMLPTSPGETVSFVGIGASPVDAADAEPPPLPEVVRVVPETRGAST